MIIGTMAFIIGVCGRFKALQHPTHYTHFLKGLMGSFIEMKFGDVEILFPPPHHPPSLST